MERKVCSNCGSTNLTVTDDAIVCNDCQTVYQNDVTETEQEMSAQAYSTVEAQQENSEFAPQGDSAPQGNSEFTPQGDSAPQGNSEFAPQGNSEFAPQGNSEFAPQGNSEFAPQGNNFPNPGAYTPGGYDPNAQSGMIDIRPVKSKAPIIIIIAVILIAGLLAAEYFLNIIGLFGPKIDSISIGEFNTNFRVGDTYLMYFTTEPALKGSDADKLDVEWSSSNTAVATVDADGKLRAVGDGTCAITLRCGKLVSTCTITVKSFTAEEEMLMGEWDCVYLGDTPMSRNNLVLNIKDNHTATLKSSDGKINWTLKWESLGQKEASGEKYPAYRITVDGAAGSTTGAIMDGYFVFELADYTMIFEKK